MEESGQWISHKVRPKAALDRAKHREHIQVPWKIWKCWERKGKLCSEGWQEVTNSSHGQFDPLEVLDRESLRTTDFSFQLLRQNFFSRPLNISTFT